MIKKEKFLITSFFRLSLAILTDWPVMKYMIKYTVSGIENKQVIYLHQYETKLCTIL